MSETATLIDRKGRNVGTFHVEAEWLVVDYYGCAYTRRSDGTFREDDVFRLTIMDKVDV